jgi:hypothetical protein
METLHKNGIDSQINIEPGEGSRPLLCSNKASYRDPSLGFLDKEKKLVEIRSTLKSLVSHIIEVEINNYINNLYAKK